jgi:hypothetical protein
MEEPNDELHEKLGMIGIRGMNTLSLYLIQLKS